MPQDKVDQPRLWIVAGPNGSGKSTLYTGANVEDFGQSVWVINPDALAKRIAVKERQPLQMANLDAVRRIEEWLWASVNAYQTIGVETVLSTSKYRSLVVAGRKKGFEIRLIYVLWMTSKRTSRVRKRVAEGGHDVPTDKIRERYKRSLSQLPWFLQHTDQAWIFDNSGEKPRLIASKRRDSIEQFPSALPEIRKILNRIRRSSGRR